MQIHVQRSPKCTSARDLATGCQVEYRDPGELDQRKKKRASWCTLTLWWRKANRYVFSLAEPLPYDDPPASYLSSTPGSAIVKRLEWYWLASDIRTSYASAINSYVSFYAVYNEKPWPTPTIMLEGWAATQLFGSKMPKQDRIKSDAVLSYLSSLKSYHIDRRLSLRDFDNPRMALIIKGGRRLFPSKKRNRLPITKEILEKITEEELLSITDLNVDTAFKVAWAGFMRMGELTYTAAEAKKATFAKTDLTRSEISFAEGD